MFRSIAIGTVAALLFLVSGCSVPQGAPVYGGIYTMVKGPLGGVNDAVQPSKTGSATSTSIVGIATGNSSITAAMQAGGITKVHHAESESFSILSFYATYRTTVHGE